MRTVKMNPLSYVEVNPQTTVQKSIIWLHGLGADGHDFASVVNELRLPIDFGARFIFPHAPTMPVTANQGMVMPAWFDIYAFNVTAKIDEQGIAKSVNQINQLIAAEEARGIKAQHIMLAGFSQGAVIALSTALRYPHRLAGILALSGYLPLAKQLFDQATQENHAIPIFIAHGEEDTIVPYALGKTTYMNLKQAGYFAEWHNYPMAHSVCAEEIKDISHWMQKIYQYNNLLL